MSTKSRSTCEEAAHMFGQQSRVWMWWHHSFKKKGVKARMTAKKRWIFYFSWCCCFQYVLLPVTGHDRVVRASLLFFLPRHVTLPVFLLPLHLSSTSQFAPTRLSVVRISPDSQIFWCFRRFVNFSFPALDWVDHVDSNGSVYRVRPSKRSALVASSLLSNTFHWQNMAQNMVRKTFWHKIHTFDFQRRECWDLK